MEMKDNDLILMNPENNNGSCKCGSSQVVLTQKLYGSFCRECFLSRMSHKFRSEFGRARVVRDDEEVLVAFSGGCKSSAMLHLILEGKSKRAQKKLRFKPHLVCILPSSNDLKEEALQLLLKQLLKAQAPFQIFSQNQMYNTVDREPLLRHQPSNDHSADDEFERMTELLREKVERMGGRRVGDWCSDKTSREATERLLMKELLVEVARRTGVKSVLLGGCAEDLAVRVLSDMCQGRGGQLAHEVEFVDQRNADVIFVKPMRSFLMEELTLFLKLTCTTFIADEKAPSGRHSSIDRLTEEFFNGLQKENNNTLSIVCRTGEKLCISEKIRTDTEEDCKEDDVEREMGAAKCCLCKSSTKSGGVEGGREIMKESLSKESVDCCEGSWSSTQPDLLTLDPLEISSKITRKELLSSCCYACRIIVHRIKDISVLPDSIAESTCLVKNSYIEEHP